MQLENLIAYYRNLLILQYKKLPRATKHLEAFLRQVVIFDFLETVSNGFDLETAEGNQLTKLGFFLGVDREVRQIHLEKYFGSRSYTTLNKTSEETLNSLNNLVGSRSYERPETPGKLWNYQSLVEYTYSYLSDSQLRKFIKMKIAINRGNCSLKSIDDFFQTFFGGQVSIIEHPETPMVLTYGVERPPSLVLPPNTEEADPDPDATMSERLDDFFLYTLEKEIFPKPAGVGQKGGNFVHHPLRIFSSLLYSADLQDPEVRELLKTGLGALNYTSPPLGVTALYNHREETYA